MSRRISRGVLLLLVSGSAVGLEVFVENESGDRVSVSNAPETVQLLPPCQAGGDHVECLRPYENYVVLPSSIHSKEEEDEEPAVVWHPATVPQAHSVFEAVERPVAEEQHTDSPVPTPEPMAALGSIRTSRKDLNASLIAVFVVLTGCVGAVSIMYYLVDVRRKRTQQERMQRGTKWVADSYGWC